MGPRVSVFQSTGPSRTLLVPILLSGSKWAFLICLCSSVSVVLRAIHGLLLLPQAHPCFADVTV